jgi:hypothetical protein
MLNAMLTMRPPRAHIAINLSVLVKQETTVVPQPAYSPDPAPADFFIPKFKNVVESPTF